MIFSVKWSMPSKWTFQIKPISEFVHRYYRDDMVSVDMFCGQSDLATHKNDLSRGGKESVEYMDALISEGVSADLVFFDPPYSPRQISECYKSVGLEVGMKETQNGRLYSEVKKRIDQILKPGGIVLCFGWQSCGMGKGYETIEIMLVQHGGAHNDTICVAQRKPVSSIASLFDGV